ncbi:radical SAM protein [Solemya pervernicosa gill symbiont]|uniref:Radical SAM protein n=2 Tax=Gammaproteobacteria incertae sedis TaxID=118884 RepID=A0A1T2L444_9GAMM|nr:radical SAM protein [Candidatus Reidiella endopervernicosa]OOZ39875.1 radical SAM protein [Solemya pervernicosa gill symbiont]QKQ25812.1 radical SAM protein [Candidatus Reidiella endopervernicosa]
MSLLPLNYVEPLYRPPSEAGSLILQATLGCSWNRCGFCEMYRSKQFRPRPESELFAEIEAITKLDSLPRKLFLADGDAMVLSSRRLLSILHKVQTELPKVGRVSAYAMPRNITNKSDRELRDLRQAGLRLLYVGIESGDNEVLQRIDKGETAASTIEALCRTRAAGIKLSVMIINGLGGASLSERHALHSAEALNAIQPEYLSTLALMLPEGEQRFREGFDSDFQLLERGALLSELEQFVSHCELKNTIFRSDHASNYLALKGILGRDKQRLLTEIRTAIDTPEHAPLREMWQRGL